MDDRIQRWNDLAAQIGVDSIRCTTEAGSGHPTSSLSCTHLLAVLFASHLRTDVEDPRSLANDRFIMSKGHAAPALYSTLKAIGAISDEQLLSLRRFGSPIQGHPAPVPEMPWIDVATGSLGQGLAVGLGMSIAMRLDGIGGRVFVLMGDSEAAEGSVWEAMEAASFHQLDDLVAILDMNRLGQRGPTMHEWSGDLFAQRARAYGWHAIEIDGHDAAAIDAAYTAATVVDGPVFIVAKTEKGHGVSFAADQEGWHGKAMSREQAARAIEELGGIRSITVTPPSPPEFKPLVLGELRAEPAPVYAEPVATRKAFGETLAWLAGHRPDLVVIDGEVGNSTHTEDFQEVAPERFVQMYIAEQAVVGAQTGLQALGKTTFAATFGAFWTRALDQVRMGAISRADLRLCGSHAGVSIGEDGPSQMAVEDLAVFRALHSSTVLYPADGTATVKLVTAMCDLPGISYVRTTREATPALYAADDEFPIGGSKTLRRGDADVATLVGAGVTVRECLTAADDLADDGISVGVVDAYSVKPIDGSGLRSAFERTGLVIVVEDHRVEGGLGDAVLGSLAESGSLSGRVVKLGVHDMPGSGTADEMRAWAGIDAASIAARVRTELS